MSGFSIGAGLSAAGYAAGEMYAKSALMDAQSEQEMQRAMRLAEFKSALDAKTADTARVEQTARIDAKAGELADGAVKEKRGLIDANINDRSTWTSEQQAAVDQSLAMDKEAIAADGRTRERAAIATGDISAKDAAAIDRDQRKIDATENATAARERASELRAATQEYIADLRHKDAQARLEALVKGVGKSGGDDKVKAALSVIDGTRKDLAGEATNLRSLYATEIKDKPKAEVARLAAEYKPKFAAIDEQRAQLDADYDALREKVGLPPRKVTAAAPPVPTPKPGTRPPLSNFVK
jgi:hypothetical protein